MFTVYKMECLSNGKSYIGITGDLFHRLAQHWCEAKRGNKETILYRSIRKYGKENFIISEIDKTENWNEACEKEQHYIKEFNTKSPNGMNITDGGEGNLGLEVSKETRQKQSEAHLGLNIGEKSTSAKLTDSNVIDIRKQYKEGGITYRQLAQKYNVDYTNIACIISGKTWTYLDEDILSPSEIAERASISRKAAMAGEKHHQAKLSEQDIVIIRRRYKNEIISASQLAKEYYVTKENINNIISGRSWSHIPEGILTHSEIRERQAIFRKATYIGENGCNHKLTENDVISIRKQYEKRELNQYQLAEKYNVHQGTIYNIVTRRGWTHI